MESPPGHVKVPARSAGAPPAPRPDPVDSADLLARLRSAQGHLRAVENMVITRAPAEDVLQQLWCVEAALGAARTRIVAAELEAAVRAVGRGPSMEERTLEAARLERILARAMQHRWKAGG